VQGYACLLKTQQRLAVCFGKRFGIVIRARLRRVYVCDVKQHDASLLALIELIRACVRKDFEIVGGVCFLGILKYHYVAVINVVTLKCQEKRSCNLKQ
jgi:hypothetical protein